MYVGCFPMPIMSNNPQKLRDKLRNGPYRIGRRAADREPASSNTFKPHLVYAAYPHRKSPTVCAMSSRRDAELVIVDPNIPGGKRQMEWQEEAAALQAFPEDYVFWGPPTSVWKMIGQAIQIDTGRAILREILKERPELRW